MKIIFYDGECGFCNKWVEFYLTHRMQDNTNEEQGRCYLAPLQGETAHDFLGKNIDVSSIVFWNNNKQYTKSTAVIKIMKQLNWRYRCLAFMMMLIPKCIRDLAYNYIAKRRKKLLAYSYCYVPKKEEKSLFLD